jgi:hypothetical protein
MAWNSGRPTYTKSSFGLRSLLSIAGKDIHGDHGHITVNVPSRYRVAAYCMPKNGVKKKDSSTGETV